MGCWLCNHNPSSSTLLRPWMSAPRADLNQCGPWASACFPIVALHVWDAENAPLDRQLDSLAIMRG